eukprot:1123885-Amorphochlora_amoeboformis.AAC.2
MYFKQCFNTLPAGLQLGQIPEESDSWKKENISARNLEQEICFTRTTSALPPLAPAEGYEHRIVRDSVPAPAINMIHFHHMEGECSLQPLRCGRLWVITVLVVMIWGWGLGTRALC